MAFRLCFLPLVAVAVKANSEIFVRVEAHLYRFSISHVEIFRADIALQSVD